MARPKVIIADEDTSYIVPLQFKFVTEFFNKIDLIVITDKAYFDDFFSKPQNAEILIVSDELYASSLQRHNIQNVFVMMEQYDEGGTGELSVNRLFKYTSIKEIYNEIIGKSAGALNVAAVDKKETQIILVTSAAGGVGKTTVAMGVAACLAQNYKRVLYINASRLQNFQFALDNGSPITSPDVYANLLNASEDIYKEIKHIIRKEIFSYVPPFKAALLSLGVDFSIYVKLALSAKQSGEYDFVIIDSESTFDESKMDLIDMSDKVIIVTDQSYYSVASTNLLLANINGVNSEKYIYVCNKFNKDEENSLIAPQISIKFNVNEYVEKVKNSGITDCGVISQIEGLKKVSFLVI